MLVSVSESSALQRYGGQDMQGRLQELEALYFLHAIG